MKQNKKLQTLGDIAGWYGTAAILLAYVLVSFEVLDANGIAFQLLNLTAAVAIVAMATIKRVRQTQVLNVVWAVIALVAIARIIAG